MKRESKYRQMGDESRLILQQVNREVGPYHVRPRDPDQPRKRMQYAVFLGGFQLTEWKERGKALQLALIIKKHQVRKKFADPT